MKSADDDVSVVETAEALNDPTLSGRQLHNWRGWYTVFALTMLSGVAAIDRTAISLVVDDIKVDFRLSDLQLSLLLGFSFALFNLITSVAMGSLVDRFNRKYLIMAGAALWAITTTLCGLATNFWQLFLGRVGVGFSEGGLGAAAFSLIRDSVTVTQRGRAFALLGSATYFGGSLSLLLGSIILAGLYNFPLIGSVKPWHAMFILMGLASLPFVALMAPVREPDRLNIDLASAIASDAGNYFDVLGYVLRHWRLYLPLTALTVCVSIITIAFGAWTPALLHRNFGISLSQVGLTMAPMVLVIPAAGQFTIGSIMDWLTKRGQAHAASEIAVWVMLIIIWPVVLTPLMPSLRTFWFAYAAVLFVSGGTPPITQVLLSGVTKLKWAGKIFGLFSIIQVVGGAIGVAVIGSLSTNIFKGYGAHSLAVAVSATSAISAGSSVPFAFWLRRTLRGFGAQDEDL